MDIEDILYFAFLIGSILFTALRKKKKTSPKQKRADRSIADQFDILQNIIQQKEVQTSSPISEPIATVQKEEDRFKTQSSPLTSSKITREEGGSALRNLKKDELKKPSRVFSDRTNPHPGNRVKFDLKKAIIYEAILKRPEW